MHNRYHSSLHGQRHHLSVGRYLEFSFHKYMYSFLRAHYVPFLGKQISEGGSCGGLSAKSIVSKLSKSQGAEANLRKWK